MPQASVEIRVPFSDVDSSGRIHFTAMFRYMDIAEHELVRSIGLPRATTFLDIAFPRVYVACDFHRAIRYDDELTIEARVDRVGHSSWTVAFTARFTGEARTEAQKHVHAAGEIAAEGHMTIVAMDPQTERARRLPGDLRNALAAD